MNEINNPHDTFVSSMLERESVTLDLLQHELPAEIAKTLDFTTLKRLDVTYIGERFQKEYSDKVFLVNYQGSKKQAHIYMLFEHKSYPDNWCSLQLLKYMSGQWQTFMKENPKATKLPPIIPLVLYHGEGKWRRKDIVDLLDAPSIEAVRKFTPNFDYVLWDVAHMDAKRALYRPDTKAFLMILHHGRKKSLKEELPVVIMHLRQAGYDKRTTLELIEQFLTYAVAVNTAVDERAIENALETLDDREELMGTLAEKWLEQGIERGILLGELQGQAKVLYRLIEQRFGFVPPLVEERLSHASAAELERFALQIFDAPSAYDVVKFD